MMSAASPSFTAAWNLRHGALHVVGQRDVLDLHRGDLGAPRLGMAIDHVLDLLVDARGVGEKLVEAETPDHVAHGGLADLVDGVVDILDRDDGSLGIGDVIVGDRRDVDRDVVLGDDLLRGNLHRDGAQGYAHHLLDRNENQGQPRSPHALEFSKKKHHAALVLPQHPDRGERIDDDRDEENETDTHQRLHLLASTVRDAIGNARPTDTPDRLRRRSKLSTATAGGATAVAGRPLPRGGRKPPPATRRRRAMSVRRWSAPARGRADRSGRGRRPSGRCSTRARCRPGHRA